MDFPAPNFLHPTAALHMATRISKVVLHSFKVGENDPKGYEYWMFIAHNLRRSGVGGDQAYSIAMTARNLFLNQRAEIINGRTRGN